MRADSTHSVCVELGVGRVGVGGWGLTCFDCKNDYWTHLLKLLGRVNAYATAFLGQCLACDKPCKLAMTL